MLSNLVSAAMTCPRCGALGEVEIEVVLDGHGALHDYHIGDTVKWNMCYGHYPGRPPLGDLEGDGYAVCPKCEKDFFVTVFVVRDVIARVEVVRDRSGYIPN